ncbi:MAG: precorrin-8X methylmutase [Actinomycetota bacterium]|nr:precorrin-8X methylmutase [Actinomycetota bacterium]
MGKRTLKKKGPLTAKAQTTCAKAKINTLMARPISGQEIEDRSFAIIEREVGSHPFNKDEWEVVRRLIHTSGDLSIANFVSISNGAIDAGIAALKSLSSIYVDSRMIQAGISLERLQMVNPGYSSGFIHSYVANEDVIIESKSLGIPRSLLAVQKAKGIIDGALVAIGNSPTALLELNRLVIEEGISPALVIAMPVGFVHVEESKEELSKLGVAHITLCGRRGGSPLAVSVIHALSILASGKSHKGG